MAAIGGAFRSFWHALTSYDRHASHDSQQKQAQHLPLNSNRHAPLTSVATNAMESRTDLSSPYPDSQFEHQTPKQSFMVSPQPMPSPGTPYSPGQRTNMIRRSSQESTTDYIGSGEIQMQNFQEGLPPAPPVSHSWGRIDRWAEAHYEELYDQLGEGATNNDLNELEHQLDCSLPLEVRQSLQIHDGQERGGRPTGILFGCMLLDCEEIVQEWNNWKIVNEEYLSKEPISVQKTVASSSASTSSRHSQGPNPNWRQELLDKQESQPPRAVQKAYAHPAWIPLARDWGGNNVAVDLAPGPAGKWGQVILFGRDYDCKYVISRSWSAFLATVADDISSDKVFVDEETQELKLKEFKTQAVEPPYIEILRWRTDQRYGRRPPRPKMPNNMHSQVSQRRQGGGGSPYGAGSPTDERGRSPNRFSGSAQSPRGKVSSPLTRVVEEGIAQPVPLRPTTGLINETLPEPDKSTQMNGEAITSEARIDAVTKAKEAAAVLEKPATTTEVASGDPAEKDTVIVDRAENSKADQTTGLGIDKAGEMQTVAL